MLVADDCYNSKKSELIGLRDIVLGASPYRNPLAPCAGTAQWAWFARKLSIGEIIIGLSILLLSARYLYQFTESTGIFLGAMLSGSGLVGFIGGRRRSSNLLNLQLIASIVGILLAFQWLGEVSRDAQIDCALSELYQLGRSTDEKVTSLRQSGAIQAVYNRLNEMEDMLHLVQEGAAKSIELKQEQQKLAVTDANYIRSKIDMVRRHAEDILNSVLKNPNVTADNINTMPENDKAALRKRLDTADRVLEKIQIAHQGDPAKDFTIEEYIEVLEALTDGDVVPDKANHPELMQARVEVPNMKAALVRQKRNNYENLAVGTAYQDLKRIDQKREEKRNKFRDQFNQMLNKLGQSGRDYLADLPEHCLKETRGEKVVFLSGMVSIALQLASAYVSLSLSLKLPSKKE